MKKTNGIVFFATLLMLTFPATAGDQSNMAQTIVAWEKAYNGGNPKAIAAFYAEDAVRMPYQAPAFKGRDAIVADIQANYDAGVVKIDLELGGSETQGNMGWGHGTYHLMDADGNTVQQGKWMNVSKKVGKDWLIQADIWNTDAPEE